MVNVPRLDAYHLYENDWESHEHLSRTFEWEIPETFNLADYLCDRWAQDEDRVYVYHENEEGETTKYTFQEIRDRSNQLANYLADHGVTRGDRVGVNTPSKPETAIAHLATWKLGAVSVPMSTLYGPDGLGYRLDDCDAKALVIDKSNTGSFREISASLPELTTVLTVDEADRKADERDFWNTIEGYSTTYDNATMDPDENAVIAYTGGTTGDPKGVLHGHRFLLGYLPGLVITLADLEMTDRELVWSTSSWAWTASFSALMYSGFYGIPILAHEGRFKANEAFRLIEEYDVTQIFIVPTALRMLMQIEDPQKRWELDSVRSILSGGESLGENTVRWVNDVFDGAAINEGYGQTEVNPICGESTKLGAKKEGSMGRPHPGRTVRIVDPKTAEPVTEPNEVGEIAVQCADDPGVMKEYWNKETKTRETIRDGWLLTGDLGSRDEDGFFYFVGRKDDVIISSGYRIGPEEVEDSICGHEAVADAGIIGVPDDVRGEIPKAFVKLKQGIDSADVTKAEIKQYVKDNLAKHEYPRKLEFVDELPQTPAGKIRRKDLRKREGLL